VTAAFDNSEGDEEKNNKSSFYNMWGRSPSQQKKKLYSKYLNVCFLCYVSTGGPVVHPAVSAVSENKDAGLNKSAICTQALRLRSSFGSAFILKRALLWGQ